MTQYQDIRAGGLKYKHGQYAEPGLYPAFYLLFSDTASKRNTRMMTTEVETICKRQETNMITCLTMTQRVPGLQYCDRVHLSRNSNHCLSWKHRSKAFLLRTDLWLWTFTCIKTINCRKKLKKFILIWSILNNSYVLSTKKSISILGLWRSILCQKKMNLICKAFTKKRHSNVR